MTSPSSQVDSVTLGTRLKSARKTAGLTQGQVAEKLGVARTTIVAIEKGERRVKPGELVLLAQLYGESAGRLLRPTALVPDLVLQFRLSRARPTSDEESIEDSATSNLVLGRVMSLLAAEAYARGMLSEGQVASMLGIDRVSAREILDDVCQAGLGEELPGRSDDSP